MIKDKHLSKLILNEIVHDKTILFERITLLMESLENKIDPNPEDIVLVDSIYQYLEKKKILEQNLKNYTRNIKLYSNKLEELIENSQYENFMDI